jgi:hypothetical protein
MVIWRQPYFAISDLAMDVGYQSIELLFSVFSVICIHVTFSEAILTSFAIFELFCAIAVGLLVFLQIKSHQDLVGIQQLSLISETLEGENEDKRYQKATQDIQYQELYPVYDKYVQIFFLFAMGPGWYFGSISDIYQRTQSATC